MKRTQQQVSNKITNKKCLTITTFTLLLTLTLTLILFRTKPNPNPNPNPNPLTRPEPLPRFAYLLTGTQLEWVQLKRLLQSIYHPRNYYILHLDLEAADEDRIQLAKYVNSELAMRYFNNVMVIGKPDLVTFKGPTVVTAVLHSMAVLVKMGFSWDWFVNLRVGDYPLVNQDDFLHIFSDLNFVEHTSDISWKEQQRARQIIIDPGLYHRSKSAVYSAKEKRSLPSSFKLFTGSERMVLTKSFTDFCIWGWDNLPRTVLMYYANFLSSSEGYFQTVACNHKNYQNTTVNHDLHFVKLDEPTQQPVNLTHLHFNDMVKSGAPFAHTFADGDPVLNKIDKELLGRMDGQLVPGGWCVGDSDHGKDPCRMFGRIDVVKPSVNSRRLEKLVVQLIDSVNFRSKQCK